MLKTNTIKFKIGVLYLLILGLILFSYSTVLYSTLRHTLYRYADSQLESKTQEVIDLLDSFVSPAGVIHTTFQIASNNIILHQNLSYAKSPISILETRVMEVLDQYELRNDYVALYDVSGNPLTVSGNISPELMLIFRQKLDSGKLAKPVFMDIDYRNKPLRLLNRLFRLKDGNVYLIQIATSMRSTRQSMQRLLYAILLTIPVMLILVGSTGRWLAQGVLKPVRAVAKTAEKITHDDLSARVKVAAADEEMIELVQAFNHMIERLEKSFNHISDFSAHVAHELKTPLAVIRGECEVALRKERENPQEYREALEANLRETQRMVRIIEDMLLLSRLDYDVSVLQFVSLNAKQFFEDLVEKARILAEVKGIYVEVEQNLQQETLRADELHLRRLFLNLIDNAIKFSDSGKKIYFKVLARNRNLEIAIADQGFGIASEVIPKIFDQFFHQDKPGAAPGNGLGLSIARSIARAHHGDIQVASQPGKGSVFTVTLPLEH